MDQVLLMSVARDAGVSQLNSFMKFHEVSKQMWSSEIFVEMSFRDQVCNQQMKSYPAYVHVLSSTALVAMAGNEICGLIATYMGAKQPTQPKSLEKISMSDHAHL